MSDRDTPPDSLRQTEQETLELGGGKPHPERAAEVDRMAIAPSSLFEQAMEQTRMAICIADPHLPGMPMVYVNQAFLTLTGYERKDVLGRNCRLLQGPETSEEAIEEIRQVIAKDEVKVVEILNYRKDGSTFWNALHIGPIRDPDGSISHYYGSQWDVTDEVEKRRRLALQAQVAEELEHRTRNLFSVIASIVRLSARTEADAAALAEKIEGRIEALGRAHAISLSRGQADDEASDLHDMVTTVLTPYRSTRRNRVVIGGEMTVIPREAVTPLGLMLHEMATNALKYGAFSTPDGIVHVEWRREGDRLVLTWREQGGPPVTPPAETGTGTRIMEGVLRMIGADLTYDWPPDGLSATLSMRADPDR